MAELTIKAFGKNKTIRRTLKLFKKTLKHNKKIAQIGYKAGASMESDEFDAGIFADTQIESMTERVAFLSEIFRVPVEQMEDEDPNEIYNVDTAIYNFVMGDEEVDESGEQ